MLERGLLVDHTTIYRWVQAYAPEIKSRCRPYLSQTNESWRVDETYIKVKGKWKYLYRAVDSSGNTIDFMGCVADGDAGSDSAIYCITTMQLV
jgi:transposase-like protein